MLFKLIRNMGCDKTHYYNAATSFLLCVLCTCVAYIRASQTMGREMQFWDRETNWLDK